MLLQEKFATKWQEIQSSQVSDGESAPMISDAHVWAKEYTTKKGHVYGLGSEGAKYKDACSSRFANTQTTQNTPNWISPEDFEAMKRRLESESREKEELRLQVADLVESVQNVNKIVEKSNKKIKRLKKLFKTSKSSSKSKASSHSSIAGKDKALADNEDSSNSD